MTTTSTSGKYAAFHFAAVLTAAVPCAAGAVVPQAAHGVLRVPAEQVSLASQWAKVVEIVDAWRHLPADWDGEGSVAPSAIQTACATSFLAAAEQRLVVPPKPYVDGAEEVGFKWKKGDGFGSVAFMDDGNIVAFVRAPGANTAYRLDEPFTSATDLRKLFRELSTLA